MPRRIGIPVSDLGDVVGVKKDLVRFVSVFGNVVFIQAGFKYNLDAVFLPGGADVDPKRYGQAPGWWTGRPDTFLEDFDTKAIHDYLGKIPVIGICRGLQTLNVIFGGVLSQHLMFAGYSKHGNDLIDNIHTTAGVLKVNSYHHQGISKLGGGLETIGKGRFGLPEAIQSVRNKVFAVQWHPERMTNDVGQYNDHWTINHIKALLE
jgi:putative glutamine amidotransferase